MLDQIKQCKQRVASCSDVFLDLVRIYLGVGLFVKGIYILQHQEEFISLIHRSENQLFAAASVLHYVIPVHLVGGAMLVFGMLTRLAALMQIPVFIGAVFYIHLPQLMSFEPRQSFEFATLLLYLTVLIVIFGAGRWSVDHYFEKKGTGAMTPANAAG